MKAREFSFLVQAGVRQLKKLNQECEREFHISRYKRWRYDLEQGTLTFSREGEPKVRATIQAIGSASDATKTWQWAWANASLPGNVTKAAAMMRAFGEREKLTQLTAESLVSDDYVGWEMTALAAKQLDAKGAYRCQDNRGLLYVIYTSIGFVPEIGKQAEEFGMTRPGPAEKN